MNLLENKKNKCLLELFFIEKKTYQRQQSILLSSLVEVAEYIAIYLLLDHIVCNVLVV